MLFGKENITISAGLSAGSCRRGSKKGFFANIVPQVMAFCTVQLLHEQQFWYFSFNLSLLSNFALERVSGTNCGFSEIFPYVVLMLALGFVQNGLLKSHKS